MMKRREPFDEVMIVNPSEGSTNSDQRVRLMRFHNIYPPELSGYAEPDPYGYYAQPQTYGYYAQPHTYGYYAQPQSNGHYPQPQSYGHYGEPEPYGYFAEDPYLSEVDPAFGYYGEVDPAFGYYGQVDPAYGYYAQGPEVDGYGNGYGQYEPVGYAQPDPIGYYAEEFPVGQYSEEPMPMSYYSQVPEMVGYGGPEPQYGEDYPGMAYYGEPDYSGYVREGAAAYNPGCPLPTNVSGFDDGEFAGYSRPATVNPSCDQFTEQPGSAPSAPDTFKPLW